MKKNATLVAIALAGLAVVSATAFASTSNLASGLFAVGEGCHWNHYSAKESGFVKNGSREYWVCCEHHDVVHEQPTTGIISDVKTPSASFVDSLELSDSRYAASKRDTIVDAGVETPIFNDYPYDAATITAGNYDPAVGSYSKIEGLTNTNDASWFRFSQKTTDLSIYASVYMYVRMSVDHVVNFRNLGTYGVIANYTVPANTWTKIEFSGYESYTAKQLNISHWGKHNGETWEFSSVYGVLKTSDTIYGAEQPMAGVAEGSINIGYGGQSAFTGNLFDENEGIKYSEAVIGSADESTLNFAVRQKTNIDLYSHIYFYVQANQNINLYTRKDTYTNVTCYSLKAGEWTMVAVNLANWEGAKNSLQDISFGGWNGSGYGGLELKFSSIYGVRKYSAETVYSAGSDYWITSDAPAIGDNYAVNQNDGSFISPYSSLTNITRSDGQLKYRPAASTDISTYEYVYFWVRSNVDYSSARVLSYDNGYDDGAYIKLVNLEANTWNLIILTKDQLSSNGITKANQIVFGKWGTLNDVKLDFSSVFGAK